MTRGGAWGAVLVIAALAGACANHDVPPVAPAPAPAPDLIVRVEPAARSVGVSDQTTIVVDWIEPVVPETATDTSIVLKIDTRRVATRRRWDDARLQLTLEPLQRLELARTHTLEIGPGVRTVSGRHLPRTFITQFTTQSLREPAHPEPADGALSESPFVALRWDSTEFGAGRIMYTIFAGTDSVAVGARSVPARDSASRALSVPRTAWPRGATLYWAVTARDRGTGERSNGPTWRFSTLPASTPFDTLIVPLSDWGDYEARINAQHCFRTVMSSGISIYVTAVRWDLRGVGDRKLANAVVRLVTTQDLRTGGPRPELLGVTAPWSACAMGSPGPPWPDPLGTLAAGAIAASREFALSSDLLTAQLEATLRRGLPPGYLIRSMQVIDYKGAESSLVLYLYREPVLAARAARPEPR